MKPLYLSGHGSISSIGITADDAMRAYARASKLHVVKNFKEGALPVFQLPEENETAFDRWLSERAVPRELDRVTKLSLYAAAEAIQSSAWGQSHIKESVVTAGSARGATDTFEKRYEAFLSGARVSSSTSPLTTLGGISSAIASAIGAEGISLGTSMTCASFMQSLCTAAAFIESGRASHALVCGAEAPLTPFTIAQMKALRIYSTETGDYPCKPIGAETRLHNSMALGEGAAAFTVENEASMKKRGGVPLAAVSGLGFCREKNDTPTGMEPNGEGLFTSMAQALKDAGLNSADALILHAPGTRLGDSSEINAVQRLFPKLPQLFSTKFLTGHTFGASGALSLELALLLLQSDLRPKFPYPTLIDAPTEGPINSVLINSAGFGGVISSVVVTRVA